MVDEKIFIIKEEIEEIVIAELGFGSDPEQNACCF